MFREVPDPATIERLLDRVAAVEDDPDPVTLEDFLDEEDILPACRAHNQRLIDYLTQESHLVRLVHIALAVPPAMNPGDLNRSCDTAVSYDTLDLSSGEANERDEMYRDHFKLPYVASEVLAAELVRISTRFVQSDLATHAFLKVIELDPGEELEPRRAAFFAKILTALLRCRHSETVARLAEESPNGAGTWLDLLVAHVVSAPIAEILVRLLDGPDDSTARVLEAAPVSVQGVTLLSERDVFQQLGEKFIQNATTKRVLSIESGIADHEAGRMERLFHLEMANLTDVFEGMTSRVLQMPLQKLEVPPIINLYSAPSILGKMIDAGLNCLQQHSLPLKCALHTTTFLLTTEANVAPGENGGEDAVMRACIIGMSPPGRRNILGASPTVARNSPGSERRIMATDRLETTLRKRMQPLREVLLGESLPGDSSIARKLLGSTRLKTVEFFVACLRRGNDETVEALAQLGIPSAILNLFLEFETSSILHHVITESLIEALGFGQSPATDAWFSAGLLEKLLGKIEETDLSGSSKRSSHVAHMIQIVDAANKFLSTLQPETLLQYVDERTSRRFFNYVSETLEGILEVQNTEIGGHRTRPSSVGEHDEFEDANVFDMEDVIEGLTENDHEAITKLAQELFRKSVEHEFPPDVPGVDSVFGRAESEESVGLGEPPPSPPLTEEEKEAREGAEGHYNLPEPLAG